MAVSPVMKFSWRRSSTVLRSMAAGTKSKPVLEQRMASDGERLWHMQRFGHGCPLHADASNSRENHSRSIILHWEQDNWGKRANERVTGRERAKKDGTSTFSNIT